MKTLFLKRVSHPSKRPILTLFLELHHVSEDAVCLQELERAEKQSFVPLLSCSLFTLSGFTFC